MASDKEIKAEFRKKASLEPDKYYATAVLKEEGFARKQCSSCNRFYWTVHADSVVCGDPACSGGFRFIDKSPAKKKLSYIEVWKEFAGHFRKRGYTPIRRYPVAARWRDDTDFVQASIYDFQPYVVSGEVEPPANPLVVPQFCLRFNDIDNVGITGAHYTGFVMIGQHAFMPPEKWKQSDYFRDIHSWLSDGLGLPNEEITYHEDAWAGGGNFGPCMEYFSRGLELGNQVYMMYELTGGNGGSGNNGGSSYKELKLKVLDMGMGQERNAWFTGAAPTSYETTFPTVVKKLQEITGVRVEPELLQKFLPYSSYLNVDEVESIDKAWESVAAKVGIPASELKSKILPLSALYSVAEHSRSLLVALSDGVLPSNVAGGYNLRVLLRRALSFIDSYGWQVELPKLCELHAEYLKPQFPELSENLNEVADILAVEKRKFAETKKRSSQIVQHLLGRSEEIGQEKLIELYDSNGISPDLIREEAKKLGKAIGVPDNFYAMVSEKHEASQKAAAAATTATKRDTKLDLADVPATKVLYYSDYTVVEFSAAILKIIDDKYVVLDQTYFYPTSGGQEHDTGAMGGCEVADVFKQGNVVVHVLSSNSRGLRAGQKVDCQIDWGRRQQLAQHHTATHILNGVCRKLLGSHVWQAGAAKFVDKARLDITHYEQLTEQQLQQIESEANKIIASDVAVHKSFVPRTEAEQRYGFSIYQGGIVPGKLLRIVDVEGLDVEACGGTHLNHTAEVGRIKILRSSKIQDGIVRLEYVAGKAESSAAAEKEKIVAEAAKLLNCEPTQVPGRVEELFEKWKTAVKKGKQVDPQLASTTSYSGDILTKVVEVLRTQPENVTKTIARFMNELESAAKKEKTDDL